MLPNSMLSLVTLHTGLLTAIWTIVDLSVYIALVSIPFMWKRQHADTPQTNGMSVTPHFPCRSR